MSFKRVDFPLTEEQIRRHLIGKKMFTRTDYIIFESSGRLAVAGVRKKRGIDLFREVLEVDVLSLPETTAFVRDASCDVHNPHDMVKKAVEHPEETVVVLGAFEHMSFLKGQKEPNVLRVVDFVPPYPSKTLQMVESVLRSGMVETPVLVEPVMVDALARLAGCRSDIVMFPCEAGKLEIGGLPVTYLDKTPPLREGSNVTLAGCGLSRKIFWHEYHRDPAGFVNVCPRDLAKEYHQVGKLHIARCCDVHSVKVDNGLALVPYGASMQDIATAINTLCRK